MSFHTPSPGACLGVRSVRHHLTVLVLGVVFLWSMTLAAHAQFIRFQNLTDEQGLGNLSVNAVAQDRDGYVLLGTQAGLYRYDGTSIIPLAAQTLAQAWIDEIISDESGRVWVLAADGLYVRYGSTFSKVETGKIQFYNQSGHFIAVTTTSVVLDVDGTLLRAPIGMRSVGAFKPLFDATTLARVPGLQKARFVVSDARGGLLIGCGVAICHEETGTITILGDLEGLCPDAWQAALQTPDGTLWARSLARLARRRPGEVRFTVVNVPGGGSSGATTAGVHTSYAGSPGLLDLLPDQHGGILTQDVYGLIDWDGTTRHVYVHHVGGLPNSRIGALTFDREGSLWFGSYGRGAFRSIGLNHWEHWTEDDGLPSSLVWSITRPRNQPLWVATDSGTVAIGSATVRLGDDTSYTAKATRGGRLWLAPSGSQLMRFNPLHGVAERFPSPGKVFDATVDPDNRLWVGTTTGLFLVADADAPAPDIYAAPILASETDLVSTDFSKAVWALTRQGAFRRDAAGHFALIVPSALFRSVPLSMTVTTDNELWIGTTAHGIQRFHLDGDHVDQLPSLLAPVIGSNSVVLIHRDHRGWIWVGTDHGIDLFNGQSWRHFDGSDGLISNDINQGAIYEDADGSMWFGTSHGLSHLIDPNRLPPQEVLHPLVTGLSLGERTIPVSQSIHFDWTQNPLVIRFVDLDYSHGRNIAFRYRLRGLDSGWNTTTEREIRYAGVPAGKFQFEMVVVDTVHGVASAPIGFTIHIQAPWWRRWWFYALCACAFTLALVGSWQVRVRLLMRNQRRLEDVVSARTAEIEQARITLEHQALSMRKMAMSDALTGLANRRAIMDALETAVAAALASHGPLAVFICDIDHFKKINDGFGHLAGDEVLRAFGARLAAAIGASEAVGRYGGEEFLVILPGDPDLVMQRARAIHAATTDAAYRFADANRTITSSGGLAFLRADDTGLSLMARADAALYRAKDNGRNRIEEEWPEGTERRRQPHALA